MQWLYHTQASKVMPMGQAQVTHRGSGLNIIGMNEACTASLHSSTFVGPRMPYQVPPPPPAPHSVTEVSGWV